ncbi:MAG: penicillin acylase family protein [Saprospiraceae bacterium]
MKILPFLVGLVLTVATIYLLNNPISTEKATIPAFGQLLNPNTGFWKNGEAAIAQTTAPTINSTELSQSVEVVYDDRLVPHIFAQNALDAMFVQGYIVAQHRLWQIDFATRATAGRLSEILGDRTLEFDRDKRRKGMGFAAENTLEAWKKDGASWELLEKYVAGINTYIRSLSPADYPIEYKILGYEPELWTPLKTALFAKSMAETLASRASDVSATNALELFGRNDFDYIYQTYYKEESPIIPVSVKWDAIRADLATDTLEQQLGSALPRTGKLPFEEVVEHLGSNNWAVNSKKSKTGNPILCGDPHLRMTLPAVWFENQIHTPEYNVYGVSLPGIPGVTIGFNENIAWSMTNVGHDISDFYEITWQDSTKQAYLLDGKYVPVKKRIETYGIKNSEPIIDTVRYTQWGPVYLETETGKDIALRWTVHDGMDDDMVGVTNAMNRAKNYTEYRAAIRQFNTPAQNFVFAAKDNDIGITVQGAFAIKKAGQGRFLLDGSKSENAWQGIVPKDHVPAVKNPARNFVASANQHSTAPDYPYVYHSEGFEAYRGRYLNRRLAEQEKWSVEDMQALQMDNYSLKAEEALPLLLSQMVGNQLGEREQEVLDDLVSWDYHFKKDALAPVYFSEWFQQFYDLTWDEVLENEDYDYILKPRHWRTVFMLRDSLDAPFFDLKSTPERENATAIVQQAFTKMIDHVDSLILKNPTFSWQEYNAVNVSHLARIAPFSRTNIPTDGTRKALNAISGAHGPSWRMVVELGDRVTAKVNYPAGQSGNPGSAYYDNFIDSYAKGEYYDALFWYEKEEAKERVLYRQKFE